MIEQLGDNLIPIMAIGCVFMFFVIWVLLATVDSIYKTSCNARLKERLIERGCSAREIDQIIKAGTDDEQWTESNAPAPPVKSGPYSVPG